MRPGPRFTRRRLVAAGGVALGSVVAAGIARAVGVPSDPFLDQLVRSVAVVGDSITAESASLLTELLRADGFADVDVDAERSRRIGVSGPAGRPRAGLSVLEDMVASNPSRSAWIVALGTNDMAMYRDYGDLIDEVLSVVPIDAPLVWVDTYLPGERLDDCELFGRQLTSRLQRRGNAALAPWYDTCAVPDADLLRSDDIHPNERGQVVFATLVSTTTRRLVLGR